MRRASPSPESTQMRRHRLIRLTTVLLVLILAGAGWLTLAPRQLGGRASYAVIVGSSMEPKLRRGDLVVLHPAGGYRVGDVVAYRSTSLGRIVLHRIVAKEGGRFLLKGDHNDFLDPDRPTSDRMVGRQWVRLPFAGSLLQRLRTPPAVAGIVAAIVLLLGATALTGRERVGEPGEVR